MRNTLLLLLAVTFFSCQKEPSPAPGNDQPVSDITIGILSPLEGAKIIEGTDTAVSILLKDKLSLHEYTVSIDDASGTNYFYQEGHSHENNILLRWAWKNTVPAGTTLILKVRASNHKYDLLEAKTTFSSVP